MSPARECWEKQKIRVESRQGRYKLLSAYTSDKGASIEAKDHNGYTVLLIIARREHAMGEQNKASTALIKLLLERGANMEARDLNGSYRLGSVG